MITSVEIKNFKSIKSLSIALPKFAVLVGPNGSGKTNIVQALELFGEIVQRGTTDPARERGWEQIVRRGTKPARGGITLGVRVCLRLGKDAEGRYSLGFGTEIVLTARLTLGELRGSGDLRAVKEEVVAESASGRLRVATDSTGWTVDAGADPILWHLFELPRNTSRLGKRDEADEALRVTFRIDEPTEYIGPTVLRILNRMYFHGPWMWELALNSEVRRFRLDASALRADSSFRDHGLTLLGSNGEGLPAAVERLRGHGPEPGGEFRNVLEVLQRVYPRIDDVRSIPIGPGRLALLFKERGIKEELDHAGVSDGLLHALALLIVLERSKFPHQRSVLVIEEPENAIHPWSVRAIMERAQASPHQLLMTTHSETVVNAVADPGSLLIVDHDDQKGTIVTPARDREAALDAILQETGQRLGDVWMDGSLGGVPRQ